MRRVNILGILGRHPPNDQGEDAPSQTWWCTPRRVANHKGVWESFKRRPHDLTGKVSGGDRRGQSSSMVNDRPSAKWGAKRVATRVAVLGFFHFRAFFRKTQILLRSHSGRNAGAALAQHPQLREHVIPSHLFRTLCWRRCSCLSCSTRRGCQSSLDALGRHRTACPNTGRLKQRAIPIERILARVCQEAGARVRFNAFMWDMNIGGGATDGRCTECSHKTCPVSGELAVDVTLRCALTRTCEPHPH